jgi:hypothetical protein
MNMKLIKRNSKEYKIYPAEGKIINWRFDNCHSNDQLSNTKPLQ